MDLYNEDCLEKMKDLSDNSIDLLFCDLPYGQTSCKWDSLIDLSLFWKEVNRICKETTPMFFTCSTKFGVSLINSNPKNFRYDLVWVKSAPCGFLNAKKMPMKKHEMIYVFYRKLPLYDLSSHSHKFLKEQENPRKEKDANTLYPNRCKVATINKYDPPLPNSVIKTELYSSENNEEPRELYRNEGGQYDPPLPNSVIRNDEGCNSMYGKETKKIFIYDENGKLRNSEPRYNPPLPHSLLEIKSEKGKHATQKPTALIEWCLKYYSKEGDTILDPTMGSGSTGLACKNMNRKFIGIEKDEKIFNDAIERLK